MNLINCSLKCAYQQEGLCGRDNTNNDTLSKSPECAFFKEKSSSGNHGSSEKSDVTQTFSGKGVS